LYSQALKRADVAVYPGAAGDVETNSERRMLNSAFGDALAYAFEFAVTPLLFAGLGWLLDRWLGTQPVLTVVLAVFGFIGVSLRTVYRYKAKVELEEEGKPWTRRRR
jgi:F0F1-type ATP synthase assembly protein I